MKLELLFVATIATLCCARVSITRLDNALPGWMVQVDCDNLQVQQITKQRLSRSENVRTWNIGNTFCAIGGDLGESDLETFAELDGVVHIQNNIAINLIGEQTNPPSWGIDRVDQEQLPLNNLYKWTDGNDGEGVNVYVVDTGILLTHEDWNGGQANFGIDCSDLFGFCRGNQQGDPHGHGTHCAGSIASPSYGVAKSASVWDVKVLNEQGSGGLFGIISGIEFVVNHDTQNAKIISMSLGAQANDQLDNAINAARDAGVTCVAAAGNENQDAYNVSPARAEGAITVGATDRDDTRAEFSNFGRCNDIFAPGVEIASLGVAHDGANQTYSGTSMACPHVAGAAAAIASRGGYTDPEQIRQALIEEATKDSISGLDPNSPNRLLFTSPK